MPISRPLAALLMAGLAGLAACAPGPVTELAPGTVSVASAAGPVTIAAPGGFCYDAESTRLGRDSVFVLFADCATLGRAEDGPDTGPGPGAILTASLSTAEAGGGDLDALARLFETDAGLASLGRGSGVGLVAVEAEETALFVHLRDAEPIAEGIDTEFWRGFMTLPAATLALSSQWFEGQGLDAARGRALLAAFMEATGNANAAGAGL